jgi:hypothetical protein
MKTLLILIFFSIKLYACPPGAFEVVYTSEFTYDKVTNCMIKKSGKYIKHGLESILTSKGKRESSYYFSGSKVSKQKFILLTKEDYLKEKKAKELLAIETKVINEVFDNNFFKSDEFKFSIRKPYDWYFAKPKDLNEFISKSDNSLDIKTSSTNLSEQTIVSAISNFDFIDSEEIYFISKFQVVNGFTFKEKKSLLDQCKYLSRIIRAQTVQACKEIILNNKKMQSIIIDTYTKLKSKKKREATILTRNHFYLTTSHRKPIIISLQTQMKKDEKTGALIESETINQLAKILKSIKFY